VSPPSSPTIWTAGRYEALAERIAPIAAEVVDASDRRTPMRNAAVVDLACGTGSAALAAAARGARVTGVDITPELLEIAAQKAARAGRSITWLSGDASATGLPAEAFDAVVSSMGIIFVEPTAQVVEIGRLLRAGGTLAFSSWVPDPGNPFFSPILEVIGPSVDSGHSPDQWGEPETITTRLADGFVDVDIESGVHTWRFPSVDAAVRFVTYESPMHVSVLGDVDAAQRGPLLAAFEAALRARSDETGVRFDSPYVVVSARRR
jgi:SAM-dependent methyltransferase